MFKNCSFFSFFAVKILNLYSDFFFIILSIILYFSHWIMKESLFIKISIHTIFFSLIHSHFIFAALYPFQQASSSPKSNTQLTLPYYHINDGVYLWMVLKYIIIIITTNITIINFFFVDSILIYRFKSITLIFFFFINNTTYIVIIIILLYYISFVMMRRLSFV